MSNGPYEFLEKVGALPAHSPNPGAKPRGRKKNRPIEKWTKWAEAKDRTTKDLTWALSYIEKRGLRDLHIPSNDPKTCFLHLISTYTENHAKAKEAEKIIRNLDGAWRAECHRRKKAPKSGKKIEIPSSLMRSLSSLAPKTKIGTLKKGGIQKVIRDALDNREILLKENQILKGYLKELPHTVDILKGEVDRLRFKVAEYKQLLEATRQQSTAPDSTVAPNPGSDIQAMQDQQAQDPCPDAPEVGSAEQKQTTDCKSAKNSRDESTKHSPHFCTENYRASDIHNKIIRLKEISSRLPEIKNGRANFQTYTEDKVIQAGKDLDTLRKTADEIFAELRSPIGSIWAHAELEKNLETIMSGLKHLPKLELDEEGKLPYPTRDRWVFQWTFISSSIDKINIYINSL